MYVGEETFLSVAKYKNLLINVANGLIINDEK